MKKEIVSFVESVKSNKKITSFDETSIKQAVVMRLLSQLGWDIFDVEEIVPDYSADSEMVDYALRIKGENMVFVSVAKPGDELDGYQNNLLDFALQEEAPLSVLTNGVAWWFYLSSLEDSEDQKRVYVMDLMQQESEDAAFKLEEFLSRDSVAGGKALKSAKSYYAINKKKIAAELVPKAWIEILSEPDDELVRLIEETTERLCDYQPDKKMITMFLKEQKEAFLAQEPLETPIASSGRPKQKPAPKQEAPPEKAAPPKKQQKKAVSNYNGRFISSFSFRDQACDVASWDEMTTNLCNILVGIHKEDFEKVLWSSNSNRPYFSSNSSDLRNPAKIQHAGIYVEVNLSPNDTVKLARNMLSIFDYPASDLAIELQDDD